MEQKCFINSGVHQEIRESVTESEIPNKKFKLENNDENIVGDEATDKSNDDSFSNHVQNKNIEDDKQVGDIKPENTEHNTSSVSSRTDNPPETDEIKENKQIILKQLYIIEKLIVFSTKLKKSFKDNQFQLSVNNINFDLDSFLKSLVFYLQINVNKNNDDIVKLINLKQFNYKKIFNGGLLKIPYNKFKSNNTDLKELITKADMVKIDTFNLAIDQITLKNVLQKCMQLIHFFKIRDNLIKLNKIMQNVEKISTSELGTFEKMRDNLATELANLETDLSSEKKTYFEGVLLLIKFLQTLMYGKATSNSNHIDYYIAISQWEEVQIMFKGYLNLFQNNDITLKHQFESDLYKDVSLEVRDSLNQILDLDIKIKRHILSQKCIEYGGKYSHPKLNMYNMRSPLRGYCVIINIEKFATSNDRIGTQFDQESLWNLFNDLGFIVESHLNSTKSELDTIIRKLKKNKILEKCDSFVFICLSHGNQDSKTKHSTINTSCETSILIPNIVEQLNNENCKILRGKPKIFIFQSCRGKNKPQGVSPNHSDFSQESIDINLSDLGRPTYKIPKCNDTLLCYATMDGYTSCRYHDQGTIYIQTLCKVISENAHDMDFIGFLTLVSNEMEQIESIKRKFIQIPQFEHQGFKLCYLNPGIFDI